MNIVNYRGGDSKMKMGEGGGVEILILSGVYSTRGLRAEF